MLAESSDRRARRPASVRQFLAEPGRLWIRSVPTAWPGVDGLWTHFASRGLGVAGEAPLPAMIVPPIDGALYLPPVAPALEGELAVLIAACRDRGAALVVQRRVGAPGAAAEDVLDLLAALLEQGAAALSGLETPCRIAVWPLIAGLTDGVDDWQLGIEALVAAGVRTVVPIALELGPAERRRLAALTDESGYQRLFHGAAPAERDFARCAAERGLAVFAPPPTLSNSPAEQFAQRVAADLLLAAELWLRLGRLESAGQELLRAARWTREAARDLRALAREGNLGVLPWLDERSRQLVLELAAGQPSTLLAELEREYLQGSEE